MPARDDGTRHSAAVQARRNPPALQLQNLHSPCYPPECLQVGYPNMHSLGNKLACFTTRRGGRRRRCLTGISGEGTQSKNGQSRYFRSSKAKQTSVGTNVSPRKQFPIKHEYALDTFYASVRAFEEQKRVPLKLWVDNGEILLPRGISLSAHTSFRSSRDSYGGGRSPSERTWGQ